jgi:hypothetical protein
MLAIRWNHQPQLTNPLRFVNNLLLPWFRALYRLDAVCGKGGLLLIELAPIRQEIDIS